MSNTATIVVEQTTTGTFAEGAITVDYPSGIVAGELMILFLFCSELDSISTPSGWTVVSNDTIAFQGDVDTDVYVYKKVVSAGDVTAGSISVDVDDTAGQLAYTCFRISNYNTITSTEQVDSGDDTSTGTTRAHTVSITPTTSGSLLLMACGSNTSNAHSTYTATGSPSFTEVFDTTRASTDTVSVVYAQINNTSEITSLGFTCDSTSRSNVLGFIVRTAVDSDTTPTFVTSSHNTFAPTGSAGANTTPTFATSSHHTFAPTGYFNAPPAYSNTAKNSSFYSNAAKNSTAYSNAAKSSTTWTNPDKP